TLGPMILRGRAGLKSMTMTSNCFGTRSAVRGTVDGVPFEGAFTAQRARLPIPWPAACRPAGASMRLTTDKLEGDRVTVRLEERMS
ncbi:MAG: hypothetical protein M3545_19735, partial [Acidobacteriota bacterium]|nr:hypothetical protein [Acidobacteriota bacterium]